jgi:Ran GTPase-activating protein (RanGAP) involved in mRNA processing and transport
MNNNREGMLNNLVLTIISAQNEIKDGAKTASAQVAEIKDDIKELRTTKEEYEPSQIVSTISHVLTYLKYYAKPFKPLEMNYKLLY